MHPRARLNLNEPRYFRNDEASDVFDSAAAMSTRLFGSACALSCRLQICAAMCHRLVKRFVAAKERCSLVVVCFCFVSKPATRLSAACWHSASGDTGKDSAVMAAAVEIQVSVPSYFAAHTR